MDTNHPSNLLRQALVADAAASGLTAALMLAATRTMADLLGLTPALLQGAGLSLVPFTLLVAYLATRSTPSRPLVWTVIALNVIWTVDSIGLLLFGGLNPTALGTAYVAGQALIVAVFAELQFFGLRKSEGTRVRAN